MNPGVLRRFLIALTALRHRLAVAGRYLESARPWNAARDALAAPADRFARAFALVAQADVAHAARVLEGARADQRATLTADDLLPLMTSTAPGVRVTAVTALAGVGMHFLLRPCSRRQVA